MRKFVRSLVLVPLLALACLSVVFAHPGKTDADGGHYNRSTGEYHYHHGYPEHQHPNGECPYDFDDQTGINSGSSSTGSSSNLPPVRRSYSSEKSANTSSESDVMATLVSIVVPALVFIFILKALFSHPRKPKEPPKPSQPSTRTICIPPSVKAPPPAPPDRPKPIPIAPPDPPPIPESEPKPTVKVDTIPHKELPPAPAHETKPGAAPDAPSRLDLSDRITIGYKGQSVTLYGVPSSFISHIGYVRKDKLLFVRMNSSCRVYIYFNVPYLMCSGFVRAESIGSFYNNNIKDAFRGTLFGFVFDRSN